MKNFCVAIFVLIFLFSCVPQADGTPTNVAETASPAPTVFLPTSTSIPTPVPTDTPEPTIGPTETPTIPKVNVGGVAVPDPRHTNPEWFDVSNPDSPVSKYAAALSIAPEDAVASVNFRKLPDSSGGEFFVMTSADGTALLMGDEKSNGEVEWQEATLGTYWHKLGKYIGVSLNGNEVRDGQVQDLVVKYFRNGVLSFKGQVRPGPDIKERTPIGPTSAYLLAQKGDMAIHFHYVIEPGKFPNYVTAYNVNEWLQKRLSQIADVIKQTRLSQPFILVMNEPWIKNDWNRREKNPLRDKYGNEWLAEYHFMVLDALLSKGLVPEQDFALMVNDDEANPTKGKLDRMHNDVVHARDAAVSRLLNDDQRKLALNRVGITKPADLKLILGVQGHIFISDQKPVDIVDPYNAFEREPTEDQIKTITDYFTDTGGVILTEVNPINGDVERERKFLAKINSMVASNQNLKGVILWNLFMTDKADIFASDALELFNPDGMPTILYYELMKVAE